MICLGFIELVGPEQAIIEGRHINSTKNSMSNFFKVLSPANNMLFRRSFLHDNIPWNTIGNLQMTCPPLGVITIGIYYFIFTPIFTIFSSFMEYKTFWDLHHLITDIICGFRGLFLLFTLQMLLADDHSITYVALIAGLVMSLTVGMVQAVSL